MLSMPTPCRRRHPHIQNLRCVDVAGHAGVHMAEDSASFICILWTDDMDESDLTGLAAREAAGHADTPPPGWTCPAIDKAQRVMRRLAWRVKNRPEAPEDEINALLAEGLKALETVRSENKQMRRACRKENR